MQDEINTDEAGAEAQGPKLKKGDFVDRVVAASGKKKGIARPIINATLAELGEALSRGESVRLPPLGRIVVKRTKSVDGGEILQLRLRRGTGNKHAPEAAEE